MEIRNVILICPVCNRTHETAIIYRPFAPDIMIRYQTCPVEGVIYLPEDQQELLDELTEDVLASYAK